MVDKYYNYAEDLDLLYINNNQNDEKRVIGVLSFGNIVFDIGEDGKILGVEIDCASKFLKMSPDQIKDLKIAKIEIIGIGNALAIGVLLATKQHEYSVRYILENEKITHSHTLKGRVS